MPNNYSKNILLSMTIQCLCCSDIDFLKRLCFDLTSGEWNKGCILEVASSGW